MKLSRQWRKNSLAPKTSKPMQKVRWDVLGLPDPRKVPSSIPIEEIRRQVQDISSKGIKLQKGKE